ncbi:MAG: hypothetical protein SOR61_09800 [Evtepia sp.]|uniref:hypothetical protein n=1 Tax=Evtepia sp. TaxID=2773933 RepID=UPI002A7659DF|nr:hypothetical protein [Evtepia sp.]MDY3015445.1 hypothetical protein [Evtepia sp.]
MEKGKISVTQLMTIAFLVLFPLGTERLPGRLWQAGGAAWLCPLLAGLVGVGIAALVSRKPLLGRGQLGDWLSRRMGKAGVRWMAAGFLLWGVVVTTAHGVRSAPGSLTPCGLPRNSWRRWPCCWRGGWPPADCPPLPEPVRSSLWPLDLPLP